MSSQNRLRGVHQVVTMGGNLRRAQLPANLHPKIYAAQLGCQPSRTGIRQRVLSLPAERRRLLFPRVLGMARWLLILGVVLSLFLLLPAAAGAPGDLVAGGATPATACRVDGVTG